MTCIGYIVVDRRRLHSCRVIFPQITFYYGAHYVLPVKGKKVSHIIRQQVLIQHRRVWMPQRSQAFGRIRLEGKVIEAHEDEPHLHAFLQHVLQVAQTFVGHPPLQNML